LVLIRGGNDIASAVAHRLFTAGYPVVILEAPQPLTVRRGMAYASAVYERSVTLEGVTAEHVRSLGQALELLQSRSAIPVVTSPEEEVRSTLRPRVIVDARLRKKARSTSRTGDAPLVIGLGPGFTAGVEAHVGIETNRGPNLGRIITEGEADPYTGEPVEIAGHSKDRYLYAPRAGIFHTPLDLGAAVDAGQVVGHVEGERLIAKVGGIIRGILKDGLPVQAGTKLVDIDPRGNPTYVSELSQKAWTIADAVLTAIRQYGWEAGKLEG
jgi:xanthine dehydrogenase accessory factor